MGTRRLIRRRQCFFLHGVSAHPAVSGLEMRADEGTEEVEEEEAEVWTAPPAEA